MKFKELLPALVLALLTTFALQYFFGTRKDVDVSTQPLSGQRLTVPRTTSPELYKALNTEIDFLDLKSTKKPVTTTIITEEAKYEFSTNGASLQRVEFKRNWGGKVGYLSTVFPPEFVNREQSALLVAMNHKTPYYFDFVDKKEESDRVQITYKANFEDGVMTKVFTVFKDEFRIDLTIHLEPKAGIEEGLQARIFFPAPLVPELTDKDVFSAIVNDENDKIHAIAKSEELVENFWVRPTLFGSQNRYFVHAMVTDRNNFVQRGYFKLHDLRRITSILEGPEIKEKTAWTVSFYFGPKEDDAMVVVDQRLQQILNYGWLSFVSRPVSKIMLGILNFFNDFMHNYGLAIILLTLLMRLLMMPFTMKAEKGKDKQIEFQKKLKHLEQTYKNDKQALASARAELIKKHGMPGLGGCLPLLLQIPLFIALAWVLSNSIELYMAPFLWIKDLSAPDPLYILPALIFLTMVFHSPTPDPKQKMSSLAIALVFGAVSSNFSAGLALYILTSTALGVVQTWVTKRFAK